MYHRVQCIYDFLAFAKKEKLPLDFFSYHSYLAPSDTVSHVAIARKALDDAGYTDTEMSLNEWLPVPSRKTLGTAKQAADVCAEMLGLQGTALDSAMIYDARCNIGIFSPLFNPYNYTPHKAYYAFKAFNELYRRGAEVASSSSDRWVTWVAAARGESDGAAVIAHTGEGAVPLALDLGGWKVRECRVTDADRTNEVVPLPGALPPHSILVVLASRQ
ncbi:MAG: hypothetical protein IKE55_04500 [Kiritimatiellae bacterium]|nr:hypothetical protein [Kiritimatiellia bacterium]